MTAPTTPTASAAPRARAHEAPVAELAPMSCADRRAVQRLADHLRMRDADALALLERCGVGTDPRRHQENQ